jgi:hypothetical protein
MLMVMTATMKRKKQDSKEMEVKLLRCGLAWVIVGYANLRAQFFSALLTVVFSSCVGTTEWRAGRQSTILRRRNSVV